MNEENKIKYDFKGLWIPAEIVLDDELSLQEKWLIANIFNLKKCFATNSYFAKLLGVSNRRVKQIISKLVTDGKIASTVIRNPITNEVEKRTLKLTNSYKAKMFDVQIEENFPTPREKNFPTPREENFPTLGKKISPINKRDKNKKENKKDILSCKHDDSSQADKVQEIISYLNSKMNTHYKPTTSSTVKKIKARLKEGFSVDDFKTVIDKKYDDWAGDDKMVAYLRPDTLFSTKFESYLNQQVADYSKTKQRISEYDKRERENTAKLLQEAREYDSRNGNASIRDFKSKLPW